MAHRHRRLLKRIKVGNDCKNRNYNELKLLEGGSEEYLKVMKKIDRSVFLSMESSTFSCFFTTLILAQGRPGEAFDAVTYSVRTSKL